MRGGDFLKIALPEIGKAGTRTWGPESELPALLTTTLPPQVARKPRDCLDSKGKAYWKVWEMFFRNIIRSLSLCTTIC